MNKLLVITILLIITHLSSSQASAHAFGMMYTLPIPFWMYSYAAIGVLIVSFLIIGFFITERRQRTSFPEFSLTQISLIRVVTSRIAVLIYKCVSVFLLFFLIMSGFIGEDIPAYNFNMTFFWVIFVLGFTYLTFFLGNIWEVINPLKALTDCIEAIRRKELTGTITYPTRLGFYPALVGYMLFIILELFFGTTPFSLSIILLQYSAITLFAVLLFGKKTWFHYGEFFTIFFRLISEMSLVTKEREKIMIRIPFTGLVDKKVTELSLLLFILFMLASTAFDGFRETDIWADVHWKYLQGVFDPLFGVMAYQVIDIIGLLIAPLLFLVLYLFTISVMKRLVHSDNSVLKLSYLFAYSLLPIVLVYNIAHYFTLLLIQGQEILRLISDPFGWGWNLFGTAAFTANPGIISASTVWHTQVIVILLGHIIAVCIAHFMALRIFPDHKMAIRSQLPMLVLMVAYTVIGLWILSQPLAVGL